MITWLEDYLRSYSGTVLMVTHDRYFLDRVTNRILELSHGKMYGYDADYSGFLELKAARGKRWNLRSERKAAEYTSDGTGMGETWLPGKDYKAEGKARTSRRVERMESTGEGSDGGAGFS